MVEIMGYFLHFSSLYPAPYIEFYVCKPYLNFRTILVLPKTAGSAQTHKSKSFIWIVWSTLYVHLWLTIRFKICTTGSNHFWSSILEYETLISFGTNWKILNSYSKELSGVFNCNYVIYYLKSFAIKVMDTSLNPDLPY